MCVCVIKSAFALQIIFGHSFEIVCVAHEITQSCKVIGHLQKMEQCLGEERQDSKTESALSR